MKLDLSRKALSLSHAARKLNVKSIPKTLVLLAAILMEGCAGVIPQPPIAPGQSVQLQPDEGIVALLMDTQDPVTQVRLESINAKDPTLDLPSMPAGQTLALFPAPAGIYCLKQFNYGRYDFHSRYLEIGCFEVTVGHISYSGNLIPTVGKDPSSGRDAVLVYQQYEPSVFLALLKQQYPQLAAAYPTAGPSPVSEGGAQNDVSKELASWIVEAADHQSSSIMFRNNTNWDVTLTSLNLANCTNIDQPCSSQKVSVAIPPNTTIKYTTLEPDDDRKPFDFGYTYSYEKTTNNNPN